jgi:16S rRNA processing protein RimM
VKTPHQSELITIGQVLKPRGVRGEVKVLPLTDIPDRFEHLDVVYVPISPERVLSVAIEHVSYYKGFIYLRFQGRSSREAVLELIGHPVQIEQTTSPELPQGVYYHYEILDSEVYTEDNQYLGSVGDILETGAHDVYVVQGEEREYLIPATEEIVVKIEREKKRITIHPLEGLLEL